MLYFFVIKALRLALSEAQDTAAAIVTELRVVTAERDNLAAEVEHAGAGMLLILYTL